MPDKSPSEELRLGTRRALLACTRANFVGQCIIEKVSPKPLIRGTFPEGRRSLPREGRVELEIRPPSHTARAGGHPALLAAPEQKGEKLPVRETGEREPGNVVSPHRHR